MRAREARREERVRRSTSEERGTLAEREWNAAAIPLAAERRLRELREQGGLFTSDLSVNGFALCHQLGLRPLSQVMGSSIYQVGYQSTTVADRWLRRRVHVRARRALADAWNEVRERAR